MLGFTLILDDIVSPNGTSSMGRLGGGGPQALWGYQLQQGQTARVALAAGVGPDLPEECVAWLEASSIDTGALLRLEDRKTPRAWQVGPSCLTRGTPPPSDWGWVDELHKRHSTDPLVVAFIAGVQILEEDGRRHEIWRTPFTPQLVAMLRPGLAQLPPAYQAARNFHVGVHPEEPSLPLLRELRQAAGSQGVAACSTRHLSCLIHLPCGCLQVTGHRGFFKPSTHSHAPIPCRLGERRDVCGGLCRGTASRACLVHAAAGCLLSQ